MGELATMDASGDTKITWNPDVPVEVESARATFDRLRKKGYAAYSVRSGGDRGEVIREFDPNAERIILAPPMVGG